MERAKLENLGLGLEGWAVAKSIPSIRIMWLCGLNLIRSELSQIFGFYERGNKSSGKIKSGRILHVCIAKL